MELELTQIGIITCLLILNCFQPSMGQVFRLYEGNHGNHEGDKEDVDVFKCSNLGSLAGRVSSINTANRCARLFSEYNCTGKSIEVPVYAPSHYNLDNWGFNDKTKSVGPCRDPCDPEVTGGTPAGTAEVVIFNQKGYKGAHEIVKLDGCKVVPPGFTGNRLQSIQTNGYCVQLYKNPNCANKSDETIEIRNDARHFQTNLFAWNFGNARSISHCSYKCSSQTTTENRTTVYPSEGQVALYDHTDFKGNVHIVDFGDSNCVNLEHNWEGVAKSVNLGVGSEVVLYNQRNCTGELFPVLSSKSNLVTFQEETRSLKRLSGFGTNRETDDTSERDSKLSPTIIGAIIVIPVIGVILSVSLVLLILRRCHPYKNIMELLSEKEIQEFLSGIGMDLERNINTEDYSVELVAQNKPYNASYEIPRSQFRFDTKSPLGMGEYGVVYRGTFYGNSGESVPDEVLPVAVKTIMPTAGAQCLRALLKEIKVMLHVGKHPNIAQLVGCCTENIRKGQVFLLMEFYEKGSLESYLQKNKSSFTNIVRKGRIDGKVNWCTNTPGYSSVANIEYHNLPSGYDFFTLLRWCTEVARGMEFLELAKVVHSDIAARNILLTGDLVAKISDFGLSRQLYCYTQYVKKHQEPLPWRWLAPESHKNREFSSQSDVWSYGVLCWEIFTLGDTPYPGVVFNESFLANLMAGLRLNKPKFATTECYNLLLRCWSEDHLDRPSFTEIVEELEEIRGQLQSHLTNPS